MSEYYGTSESEATSLDGRLLENYEITAKARELLAGKWLSSAGFFFWIFFFVAIVAIITLMLRIPIGIKFLIECIFVIISARWVLSFISGKEERWKTIEFAFSRIGSAVGVSLVCTIFIFLWTLLLIVPGIMAAYSYSMVYFIISEDKNMPIMAAIRKSKKMMYGYRWKFFLLSCRFILWSILCIFTLGIGFFFLAPYSYISVGTFYENIKKRNFSEAEQAEEVPDYTMSMTETLLWIILALLLGFTPYIPKMVF